MEFASDFVGHYFHGGDLAILSGSNFTSSGLVLQIAGRHDTMVRFLSDIRSKVPVERVKADMPMSAAVREDWPPCFESAVAELAQGINVNHTGRVFLAAMSRAMSHTPEITSSFFANAPDYNAETTAYQVNHIYEHQYTPHGCPALKTGARCPISHGDDRLCDQEWMNHPMKYLRAKQRRRYQEEHQNVEVGKQSEHVEDASEQHETDDSS